MFFKDHMFFSKFFFCFFQKKAWQKTHILLFMADKTKQKLLFENYECFSKKEKTCPKLYFC